MPQYKKSIPLAAGIGRVVAWVNQAAATGEPVEAASGSAKLELSNHRIVLSHR
jgi:hypothetical protein